jgi:hypothetical protein
MRRTNQWILTLDDGSPCLIHTGFPMGAAAHLSVGWGEHYWEPLKLLLSK